MSGIFVEQQNIEISILFLKVTSSISSITSLKYDKSKRHNYTSTGI